MSAYVGPNCLRLQLVGLDGLTDRALQRLWNVDFLPVVLGQNWQV
jgi:hypothetical protein